jgi:hypothetical protein
MELKLGEQHTSMGSGIDFMNSKATDQIFAKFSLKPHTHTHTQLIPTADCATGNETL